MADDENQEIESGEDYWSTLISRTFDEMDLQSEIENGDEILTEPILSQFLEELRDNMKKERNLHNIWKKKMEHTEKSKILQTNIRTLMVIKHLRKRIWDMAQSTDITGL